MLAVRAATPALMRSFAPPLRSFAPPLRQAFPPRAPHLGAAALPTIASLVPSALANLGVWLMNRNARRPTKANHGARPCSHFGRHQRRGGKRRVRKLPPYRKGLQNTFNAPEVFSPHNFKRTAQGQ